MNGEGVFSLLLTALLRLCIVFLSGRRHLLIDRKRLSTFFRLLFSLRYFILFLFLRSRYLLFFVYVPCSIFVPRPFRCAGG